MWRAFSKLGGQMDNMILWKIGTCDALYYEMWGICLGMHLSWRQSPYTYLLADQTHFKYIIMLPFILPFFYIIKIILYF
jgi:hypothetical protein